MTIQQTSIDAYHSVRKLTSSRQIVYSAIEILGAPTNNEISNWSHIPINQVTPRTNELVKLGFVKEHKKRQCTISGRTAIAWMLT
jgi:hypothetical protein